MALSRSMQSHKAKRDSLSTESTDDGTARRRQQLTTEKSQLTPYKNLV